MVVGCANPTLPSNKKSAVVLFLTNSFKYNDVGFLKKDSNNASLELFNAGNLLFSFKVTKNSICIDNQCYSNASLVRRFFGDDSYLGLDFRNVLLGEPIFNKEGFLKNEFGFTQTIKRSQGTLIYIVNKNGIYLKDSSQKLVLEIEYQ
ncbi:hypothetical protein [Helicobacter ibis]|uniref:Lipoprotein n=1 Tax=Helicobacter ibis TaxID=2962633 RepID=A0ABT4VDA6_9HELI|nr:hypothetical protein [Helicobacter ibis]MDA3968689.1 hypothetical protein [Helicobacter ibis]